MGTAFAFRKPLDSQFKVAAQLLGEGEQFHFFAFLCREREIFFQRNFCGVHRRLRAAQREENFLVLPSGVVRHVDRQYLRTLLVGQSEQVLYAVKLVEIFSLV